MNSDNPKIGFIGLGYAGFPMAKIFSEKFDVIGFDLSENRIKELRECQDRCGDVSIVEIRKMLAKGTRLTTDLRELSDCNVYIVSVPTPIDANFKPDLTDLISASREVGSVLKKGDIVVFESTVYPGATEEICIPVLEKESGLTINTDFFVGYSPERINPGDKDHNPKNVTKVVAGSSPQALKAVHDIYAKALGENLVYDAPSIKVAEACKIIENTQRDVNIAFMNEMAKVLDSMQIDTNQVIEAMNTKWNALKFQPGLVGGHCIGVDPYYLIDKARKMGVDTPLTKISREVNNSMADYVADNVWEELGKTCENSAKAPNILLLGFTFKENCPDIRNTKVFDIYKTLRGKTNHVDILDPLADKNLARNLYNVNIYNSISELEGNKYDAIVLCVAHDGFKNLNIEPFLSYNGFIYDIKGFYKDSKFNNDNLKLISL